MEMNPATEPIRPDEREAVQENFIEPLIYRTWALKVSIHCEGCRRKIKKILTNIDGVYTTHIDIKQQKVIVIGNVEPEILIKKILKAGRHAELWPDQAADFNHRRDKKSKKAKKKDKETEDEESTEEEDDNANNAISSGAADYRDSCVPGMPGHEQPPEVKQVVTFGPSGPSPAGADGGTDTGTTAPKKKKKKKKKKKNNSGSANGGGGGGGAPQPIEELGTVIQSSPPRDHGGQQYQTAQGPPRQHCGGYGPPPQAYYYSPTPAAGPGYTVRYSTAHPSGSAHNTTTYYSAPPTYYSYEYVDPGPGYESPPPEFYSYRSQPSEDSFEIFSEENPNACYVM